MYLLRWVSIETGFKSDSGAFTPVCGSFQKSDIILIHKKRRGVMVSDTPETCLFCFFTNPFLHWGHPVLRNSNIPSDIPAFQWVSKSAAWASAAPWSTRTPRVTSHHHLFPTEEQQTPPDFQLLHKCGPLSLDRKLTVERIHTDLQSNLNKLRIEVAFFPYYLLNQWRVYS